MANNQITITEVGVFENGKLINKSAIKPVTLNPGDDLKIDYTIMLEAPPKTRTEDEYQRVYKELLQLRRAVRNVYLAGHWTLKERYGTADVAEWPLWASLRDAAGIEPGSSTKAKAESELRKKGVTEKLANVNPGSVRPESDKIREQIRMMENALKVNHWATGDVNRRKILTTDAQEDIDYLKRKLSRVLEVEEADRLNFRR